MTHNPGFLKLVNDAKSRIPEMDIEEYQSMLDTGESHVLIDTREESEWKAGHVAGAVHRAVGEAVQAVEDRLDEVLKITRRFEHANFFAQPRGAGTLAGNRSGGNNAHSHDGLLVLIFYCHRSPRARPNGPGRRADEPMSRRANIRVALPSAAVDAERKSAAPASPKKRARVDRRRVRGRQALPGSAGPARQTG